MRALLLLLSLAAAPGTPVPRKSVASAPSLEQLQRANARFAPVDLKIDLSRLAESEQRALASLLRAARVLDAIYLRQVWAGNEALLIELLGDRSPLGQERVRAFLLNKGPWSRLDEDAPFIPGVPRKPLEANYYPPGTGKEQMAAWLDSLPLTERGQASGFYTTIRRRSDGSFVAIPYSLEYQAELATVAAHLREAAAATVSASLRKFLELRAEALLSNDYFASDVAWMELEASLEPTIGPYEVYEDGWFNAKAAFEAFITVRDDVETEKLTGLSQHLQSLENALPIETTLRNPKLGAMAPIRVVNSVLASGEANRGVQTAAYNLPNDERITKDHGAKRVMLKNIQEAKFHKVLRPIAQTVLVPKDQRRVAFDAFFTHILMHELMHGLGPHAIRVNGQATTVREALQDQYSAVEEAKADISGLWALQQLVDRGELPKALEQTMYATFVASALRSIRFGLTEAHGRGIAVQLNYLLDAGAVRVESDGRLSVDDAKMKNAARALTAELMTRQGRGDRAGLAELFAKGAVVRPPIQQLLQRLAAVPVDIAPRYVTAEMLVGR